MTAIRSKGRKGSSLVEAALTFSAYAVILSGMLDLAQVLFLHQVFADRVRAGTRYASVSNYDVQAIKNTVLYNNPNPPQDRKGPGMFGLKASEVMVTRLDEGLPADRIEVKISGHKISFFSPFFGESGLNRTFRAVIPVESLGAPN